MSAHTQDVLGNSARRALDAAAGITAKRPKATAKRVRTVRAGRRSAAANVAASTATVGADNTRALSVSAAAPIGGTFALPEWAKTSPVQVVLAGRKVRLSNRAFFLAIVGALTGVLALLLVINTSLAAGTFELQNARDNMRNLALQEQILSNKLSEVESPVGLEKKAKAMGMVAAGTSAFINLQGREVMGEAEAAQIPMTYASDKKKKKDKEKVEEQGAASDSAVASGTVDPTTGFLVSEQGAAAGQSSSGSGLRPLGLLNN